MSVRKRREKTGSLSKILKILFVIVFIILLITVGGTVTFYVMTQDLPGY